MSKSHLMDIMLKNLAVAAVAVSLLSASLGEGLPERPDGEWREGPVRYIISAEEDRRIRQIESAQERLRFIEGFWLRRDPVPATLVNEYRHEFWTRVATANRLFAESTTPGWKTDMGRYYILLGPPDDRDTTLEISSSVGRTGVRGAITWRYSHAPSPRMGTGISIVFTKDPSGEFRAETDARLVAAIRADTINQPLPDSEIFGIPLPQLPHRLSEMQLMLDLGRLDEVPSEEELLTATVTAEEFFGVIPFSARYDFFASSSDATIVAVTLNLHPDPLEPLRSTAAPSYMIVGRIESDPPADTTSRAIFLREPDFSPSSLNTQPGFHGPYIYQAVALLAPGRYRASFAAFDSITRKIGSYAEPLDVPSFAEGSLALSSLCLSQSIEPAPSEPQRVVPYVIGHLKVTPRLVPAYRNGDTFAVYYQVYSAIDDPDTHAPKLKIEYQFLVNQGGSFIPIGRSILFDSVGNSAQGWSFPLRNWPSAEFRLRVTVTDSLTGQSAAREVSFKVL